MAIFNVGAGGGSTNGVYVGTTEPTDRRTTVWIVPDGTPTTPEDIANALSISANTSTTLTGMLKGDNGNMAQAIPGTDYAGPSVGVTATLTAAGWDADAKTQTVSVAGVTATANGSLRIAQSATDEQFTAWGAAQPRVTAQADGSITVKLAGTVPTIDIPVEVLIV